MVWGTDRLALYNALVTEKKAQYVWPNIPRVDRMFRITVAWCRTDLMIVWTSN
jgi:hypothetical protein